MSAANNPNVIPGLGERVRSIRRAAGITQAQLAAALGMTQAAIGHFEVGRRSMTIPALVAIAAALGRPIDDLFPPKYLSEIRKNITRCIDNG